MLPGLLKCSRPGGVLAKRVNSGWLTLEPHFARGARGVGKAWTEGEQGMGKQGDKILPARSERWGSVVLRWDLAGFSSSLQPHLCPPPFSRVHEAPFPRGHQPAAASRPKQHIHMAMAFSNWQSEKVSGNLVF